MQTFLAYASYRESARVLDPSRLGNQFYREGLTLLRGKWRNHPASKMWRGHERSLCRYLLACAYELESRDRIYPEHVNEVCSTMIKLPETGPPWWLGDERFHEAHRAKLYHKKPDWYSMYWDPLPDLPYLWPSEQPGVFITGK